MNTIPEMYRGKVSTIFETIFISDEQNAKRLQYKPKTGTETETQGVKLWKPTTGSVFLPSVYSTSSMNVLDPPFSRRLLAPWELFTSSAFF